MIAFSYEQKLCQIKIFQAYCKLWCFRGICKYFRPTFGSFFTIYLSSTTKWTMDSGQQQNGTKLAYISNGVDKQQKLPKRGPKTLAWSKKNNFNETIEKSWKIKSHSLYFHAVTSELISCFFYSLSLAIVKAFFLILG